MWVARIFEGSFHALIGRGLCGGPQIGITHTSIRYISESGAAAILAQIWPVSGQGLGSTGLGLGGGLGLHPYLYIDQEVFSARKREQPTAPKIRATNLLGELSDNVQTRGQPAYHKQLSSPITSSRSILPRRVVSGDRGCSKRRVCRR